MLIYCYLVIFHLYLKWGPAHAATTKRATKFLSKRLQLPGVPQRLVVLETHLLITHLMMSEIQVDLKHKQPCVCAQLATLSIYTNCNQNLKTALKRAIAQCAAVTAMISTLCTIDVAQ